MLCEQLQLRLLRWKSVQTGHRQRQRNYVHKKAGWTPEGIRRQKEQKKKKGAGVNKTLENCVCVGGICFPIVIKRDTHCSGLLVPIAWGGGALEFAKCEFGRKHLSVLFNSPHSSSCPVPSNRQHLWWLSQSPQAEGEETWHREHNTGGPIRSHILLLQRLTWQLRGGEKDLISACRPPPNRDTNKDHDHPPLPTLHLLCW